MTYANRRANIAAEMEKSRRVRTAADLAAAAGDFDTAVNRLYYSAFHAATAVCLTEGLEPKSHRGLRHLLNLHFMVAGRLEDWVNGALAALEDDRSLADYQPQFTMSEQRYHTRREEADRLLGRLETFLREAKWI